MRLLFCQCLVYLLPALRRFPGTLADTVPGRLEEGFRSSVRLIGTVYFKKHLEEFTAHTARALSMSLAESGVGHMQQHKRFIEAIRERVRSRMQFECELPTSFGKEL